MKHNQAEAEHLKTLVDAPNLDCLTKSGRNSFEAPDYEAPTQVIPTRSTLDQAANRLPAPFHPAKQRAKPQALPERAPQEALKFEGTKELFKNQSQSVPAPRRQIKAPRNRDTTRFDSLPSTEAINIRRRVTTLSNLYKETSPTVHPALERSSKRRLSLLSFRASRKSNLPEEIKLFSLAQSKWCEENLPHFIKQYADERLSGEGSRLSLGTKKESFIPATTRSNALRLPKSSESLRSLQRNWLLWGMLCFIFGASSLVALCLILLASA